MQIHPNGGFAYTIRDGDTLWLIAQRFDTTIQAIMSENSMLDESNLHIGQVIRVPQRCMYNTATPQCLSNGVIEPKQGRNNRFRLLWEQHVYWTRMFILSTVFGLPDTEAVANRLLQNPNDFAAVLRKFYGEDVVSNFLRLFTAHLTIAAELVKAAKAGDSSAVSDAEKRWYANADQIAEFFQSINPYWSEQEWRNLLYDHLTMTKEEVTDMLTQKYADSIRTFADIEREALLMADTMTEGIVKLFPNVLVRALN